MGWITTGLASDPARKALRLMLAGLTITLSPLNLRRAGDNVRRLAERHKNSENTNEAQCWTPLAAFLAIAMSLLGGCAMDGSEAQASCPPVTNYSAAEQARAADEVATLPKGATLVEVLSDYAVLRDQARACR